MKEGADLGERGEHAGAVTLAEPTISLQDFGYRFGGRKNWALKNVSLDIPFGQRVLIAGPSGAGKSTLLHAITGVLGEEEGETLGSLTIGGAEPSASGVRGAVGLVQQDPESQRVMERVGDEVAFGLENLGVPREEIWPRVEEALEAVGLEAPLHHPTSQLSGGQKQRLALACAFAMGPRILALDEPTANLDPVGTSEVLEATGQALEADPKTLVVVDHNISQWLDLVDRLIVISPSGVVADGEPHQVIEDNRDLLTNLGVWVPGASPSPTSLHLEDHALPFDGGEDEKQAGGGIAVHAENLALGYKEDKPVVEGISVDIPEGQATFIVGPNGSGKSTLSLALAGLMKPLSGTLQVSPSVASGLESLDPNEWKTGDLLGRVSMVFQEPQYQFLTQTVGEELALGPTLAGLPAAEVEARTEQYLDLLGLTRLKSAHPMSLSGGERRRLAVGSALISAPKLLVLDEPTFGQDRKTWQGLVDLLAKAKEQGTTLVVITHDPHLVEALADVVIDMGEVGRKVGPTEAAARPADADRAVEGVSAGGVPEGEPEEGWKPAPLGRVNPAVQILGLIIMTVPLIMTIDPVSALVALGLELLVLPLAGLKPRRVLVRVSPLLIAAPLSGISMLLYGKVGGQVFFELGPIVVSQNSAWLAASLSLRVLAVGLPAVVVLPSISATALADSLIQVVHLPSKFVVASLAGMRMVGLMMSDWKALGRARRSRGVSHNNFFKSTFQLLTFALRRSETLSVSMEARGFGGDLPRSNARTSTLGRADIVMLVVSIAIPVLALAAAAIAGTFTWFGMGGISG